jgi:hypothetical protein
MCLWSSGVTITGTDGAAAGAFVATCPAGAVSALAAPRRPINPATAAAPSPNPPILPKNILRPSPRGDAIFRRGLSPSPKLLMSDPPPKVNCHISMQLYCNCEQMFALQHLAQNRLARMAEQ